MRAGLLFLAIASVACVEEPDYTGRLCSFEAPCPEPWVCTNAGTCARDLDAGATDAGPDRPDLGDLGLTDLGPVDLGVQITSLTVAPTSVEVIAGQAISLTAMGQTEAGAQIDLTALSTWTILDTTIAQIEAPGVARGLGAGSTVVSAEYMGTQGNAALGVLAPVVVEVSSRNKHNIALLSDGTVWAWGWNENGQVGGPPYAMRRAPVQVPINDVVAVSAGGLMSLALKRDGTLWAWGKNSQGELGTGSLGDAQTPTPVQVVGHDGTGALTDIAEFKTGYSSTLVRHSDGTVSSFGAGNAGQLGQGDELARSTPTKIPGLSGVTQIATGAFPGLALLGSGGVMTWGYNEYGQLGNGDVMINGLSPVVVRNEGNTGPLVGVRAIGGGWGHSVALMSDGSLRAWGWNVRGQLGDMSKLDRPLPASVLGAQGVGQLQGIERISVGFSFVLAQGTDGRIWGFGSNDFGQLADGTEMDRNVPDLVLTAPGGVPFRDANMLFASGDHAIALGLDGVWAWGRNDHGEMATELMMNVTSPSQLQIPPP